MIDQSASNICDDEDYTESELSVRMFLCMFLSMAHRDTVNIMSSVEWNYYKIQKTGRRNEIFK